MSHAQGPNAGPSGSGSTKVLVVATGIFVVVAIAFFAILTADDSPDAEEGYTLEEVAEHDDEESCWLAIDGAVYDVTDYLPGHPPGQEEIVPHCGTDATEVYQEVGHSSTAQSLRADRAIGVLAEE